MAAFYDLGDSVKLTFLVQAGDPLVPTNATVVLTVTAPDGTTSTPATNNPATGTYNAAVAATQAGLWLYRWVATGAATTAEDGQFYVQAAAAANVYTTLAEMKASLSIPATDTQDDDDLQDAIGVASRAVSADCKRHFHKVTETRTLAARDAYQVRLGQYMDLVSMTALKTDATGDGTFEQTWTTGDYQLLCQDGTPNVNAGPEPRPYQRIKAIGTLIFPVAASWAGSGRDDLVEIVGVWGWPQVPDPIRRATRMMAAEVFKLREAPFGAVGFAELGIIRVRDNPKYQKLIRGYRLVEAAVPFA
jgi:hypothetical protein